MADLGSDRSLLPCRSRRVVSSRPFDRLPRWARISLYLGLPVLAFLTLVAWSLSSPPGSSPDDDFHQPSIWCGQGLREGLCEPADEPLARRVPAALVESTCYAFRSDVTAGCWDADVTGLTTVSRSNTGGLYPPVFYAAMSVLATPDVATSTVAQRLANSAFAVGVVTAVFWLLPVRLRPALVISILGSCVPLGLFVFASTNPSSWALLSASITWIALFASTQSSGRRSIALAGAALFGATVGSGARADAAAFSVFSVLLVALLASRRRVSTLVPGIAALCIVIVAGLFYTTADQGAAVRDGLDDSRPALTWTEHLSNLLGVPSLWIGALGGAPLGWLDTPMPGAVGVLSFGVFAGALYMGLRRADWRRALAVALGILAMLLVPFILLAQSDFTVESLLVQPRYVLPLMTITLGIASLYGNTAATWSGAPFVLAATSLWVAASIALFQNIRRYTVGIGGQSLGIQEASSWWWEFGPSPTAVLVGGSASFGLLFVFLALTCWSGRSRLA